MAVQNAEHYECSSHGNYENCDVPGMNVPKLRRLRRMLIMVQKTSTPLAFPDQILSHQRMLNLLTRATVP